MKKPTPTSAIPIAITRKLRMVRQRKMWIHVISATVAAVAVLLAAMAIAMLIDYLATLYDSSWRAVLTTAALTAAAVTIAGWLVLAWRRGLRPERVAGDVDRQLPQLEQRWTTMTRLGPDVANPDVIHPAMLRRVATEAASWEPHVDPRHVVSMSALKRAMLCLTAITAVLALAVFLDSHRTLVLLRRFWWPGSSVSATELVGMPGDTVVGKGEPVELLAAVKGTPVQRATLFLQSGSDAAQSITLIAHGAEPIEFAHRVRAVDEPFAYRFRAGDGQTGWYTVGVAERPEIGELRLTVTPPAYTGRQAATFNKLPRRVSAIEKSELQLAICPNMPLAGLKLQFDGDRFVELTAEADGWFRWTTKLAEGVTISPLLTESHGLTNRRPPTCRVSVLPDRPPIVKITSPDDQIAVRPDETVKIQFVAQDDVGIGSAELVIYDETDLEGGPIPLETIPIPLNDQQGARRVEGTVDLDLTKYAVADGNRLGYEIRVRESRNDTANTSAAEAPDASLASAPNQGRPAPGSDTPPAQADRSTPTESALANNQQTPSETTGPNSTARPTDANGAADTAMSNTGSPNQTPGRPSEAVPGEAIQPNANTLAGDPTSTDAMANNTNANPADARPTDASDRQTLTSTNAPNATSPNGNMADASGPQNPNSQKSDSASDTAQSTPPSSSVAGDPSASSSSSTSPPDSMTRRSLDVAQASTSQRMRLEVDEWAGSFTGRQRQKLEMAIAPELAALDEALARAQRLARGVLDAVESRGEWRGAHDRDVTNAERSTVDAQQVIRNLKERTHSTPYAFIGLQLSDIGVAHVDPARNKFWTALQADGDARVGSLREGWQHVTRARQMLAELDGQFRRTQREFELAESIERVKKMYQVFIEDSLALLNAQPGDPNRYPRKMAELEYDEEYLERLREVLEMRRDMQAELARILAEDPRLLRRFLDALRNRTENLREALADLVADQNDLNREVRAYTLVGDEDRPRIAQILLQRQIHDTTDLALAAGDLQDRYQTWLPLARQAKDADLQLATKLIQSTANAANELNTKGLAFIAGMQRVTVVPAAAETEDADAAGSVTVWDSGKAFNEMHAEANRLSKRLRELEVVLRQMGAREDDAEIAVFAANRLVESRRLIADTTAWIRQIDEHRAGNYPRAAEVEQYRLAEQTDRLAGRLGDIEQTLVGLLQRRDGKLPEPIAEQARAFLVALDKQASPNQMAAVRALGTNELPRATERQAAAYEGLTAAEKAFDNMMRLAVAEMDKLPVQDPIANLLDDPTLDELLAALEQELPLAELLGISPRPTNLQIIGDWLRPGGGGGGSGMGSGQGMVGNQMRQRGQRARQRLERSYREAIARALNETNERQAIELPQPAVVVHWNRLVSELGDDLRQGNDKAPPEPYRRAIEQFYTDISRIATERQPDSR